MAILSNQALCHDCGDMPFSAHRHDFKSCRCGKISVDGGMAYIRRAVAPGASFTNLSILIEDSAAVPIISAIDGGMFDSLDAQSLTTLALSEMARQGVEPIHTDTVDDHKIRAAALEGVQWALTSGRNSLGVLCAIARYVRDAGSGWQGLGVISE